jgi:fluoride exporter
LSVRGSACSSGGSLEGRPTVDSIVSPDVSTVVRAGFLGGYTTFSAASLVTIRLVEQRRWTAALASSLGMVLGASAAAALGLAVGLAL